MALPAHTQIGKLTVDVDTEDESDRIGCWISYKGFTASLQKLQDFGYLENMDTGEHYDVDPYTISDIEYFAEKHGYGGVDETE